MTEKTHDLCYMPATQLLDLYAWKTVSPVDVAKAVFARIHAVNDTVNAFTLLTEELAMEAARQSEARWSRGEAKGLLDGIPVSVKDIVLHKDWPTLRGSRAIPDDQAHDEDAPCVARLREHGAVFIGRTATPEFGWKGVTDSPLSGITRNPWDISKTPGGSSGGASVAAALGMGALHIGTDGGGSVRIPSGFTGTFGLKPSYGRVPAYPASPFGTLAHIGPMTRTVADAALMMNVLAEPDARDWTALPYDPWNYQTGLELGVKRLRIGFSANLGYADVDPEIAQLVSDAAAVFAELGAEVEAVDPGFDNPLDCFNTHWYTGARRLVTRFSAAQQKVMDPGLLEIVETASHFTLPAYMDAVDERAALGLTMNRFHDTYDLLLTPTLPIPAFEAGQELSDPASQSRWPDWTPFSYPFNLTGQPACSVPCGFTRAGLPAGLQIVGPMHGDPLVMRAAAAFEAVRPFKMPLNPISF
ncbi:MAG: amidase [Rhodospirillales bacterium]|nr:amidase [Rhodospirillales bacterium]